MLVDRELFHLSVQTGTEAYPGARPKGAGATAGLARPGQVREGQ